MPLPAELERTGSKRVDLAEPLPRGKGSQGSLVPGPTQLAIKAKSEAMTDEETLTITGQEASGMIIGPGVFTKADLIAAK